jgi:formylglycine-generating enzyme required for sulfatase activity
MNNGQGYASTETGAYTLAGGTPIPTNALNIHRNPGAKTFLPSENEWYKAAYYDVTKKQYYLYPGGTNAPMQCALPGPTPNTANCGLVTAANNPKNPGLPSASAWFFNDVSNVGAYTNSRSPNGTFDQGGNVFQWTDELETAVTDQYQAGSNIAPLLDRLDKRVGSPYIHGFGPLAILRGTDFGDSGDYNAANNRSADFSADIFETYGLRLASV